MKGQSSGEDDDHEFREAQIPACVLAKCGRGSEADIYALGAAPFVVATGQALFDVIVGAIDKKGEELKKLATAEYGATAIARTLTLQSRGKECVVVTRRIEDKIVLLLALESYGVVGEQKVRGLSFTPAYLRVDKAAAQTEKAKESNSKIKMTESVTIAAAQTNTKTESIEVSVVTTTAFTFPVVELGEEYVNPMYVSSDYFSGETNSKKLLAKPGPLFAPLREVPTVGAVSVSITELGAAASFDEVSATEKAIRTSIRSAIGKSIESRLSDD